MKDFLMAVGVVALCALATLGIAFVRDGIGRLIENLKLKLRQKHRFDKPPHSEMLLCRLRLSQQ